MAFLLSIRPEALGARLKNARTLAKLTQEAAAQVVGMARTTVVAIEAGRRPITPSELRAFAGLYHIPESDLLAESRQPLDMEVKFRSQTTGPQEADELAVMLQLNKLAASAIEIETLVRSPHPHLDFPPLTFDRDSPLDQQAEDAALSLRQRLGIGLGPIQDLNALIESDLGLRVFERPLPSRVSGATAFDETFGGFVLVNAKHPLARRRLTAAHEICHPLLRKLGPAVLLEGDRFDDKEDKFCDAFARAFLMPAVSVRKKVAELKSLAGDFAVRHLLMMAIYFNVSIEAMVRRLEGLGLVDRGLFESLREQGLGSKHLEAVRKEMGNDANAARFTPRLLLLAGVAFDRELLSEQQIAHKLDLDLVTVRRVLSEVSAAGGAAFDPAP